VVFANLVVVGILVALVSDRARKAVEGIGYVALLLYCGPPLAVGALVGGLLATVLFSRWHRPPLAPTTS